MERVAQYWKHIRDAVLAVAGLAILAHETLSFDPEPLLVGAALVLLGLPATLRLDERGRGRDG